MSRRSRGRSAAGADAAAAGEAETAEGGEDVASLRDVCGKCG